MKLENEFSVAAPLEETWATLLDLERVATCLPGATIETGGEDGVYRGKMKVKLGPMTVNYEGTARFQEVDEDNHTASIAVQAREARGQGTAAAVISNRLEQVNSRTKVTAVTDLKVTGRQAQFGRGIMEDVADSMMKQFAERLEEEIRRGPSRQARGAETAAREAGGTAPGPAQARGDDALDVGNVLAGSRLVRYAGLAGLVVLALSLLALLLKARGRRYRFEIDLRR
jgi:carbon monoxide dehydrogenase subunit G